MAKHAVVRTDLLSGTTDGSQLNSVIFYKDSNPAAIDNAQLVVLDEQLGRETYKAVAPKSDSTRKDLRLTAGVEMFYDQSRTHYLTEWENEVGKPMRVYALPTHGGFSATVEAFDKKPEKGKFVGFTAESTKITVQEAADDKTFGKVTSIESSGYGEGRYEYYYITLV